MKNMKIDVSFYFRSIKEGIECTSQLNSDFRGIGSTEDQAFADYSEKFNTWSAEMKKEVIEILDNKNVVYSIKDMQLVFQTEK